MKRFESGDALAKEFGVPPSVLKKTFEDYNQSVRTKKDPFGKKVWFIDSVRWVIGSSCPSSSSLASGLITIPSMLP